MIHILAMVLGCSNRGVGLLLFMFKYTIFYRKIIMKVSDILTDSDKRIINSIVKQSKQQFSTAELVWRSLQLYFAKLAGRIR